MLLELQQEIAARLEADAFFADVQVLTQKVQDLDSEIERALATLGVSVVILTPNADVTNGDLQGPRLDPIRVVIACAETPVLNAAGPRALACAERALALLHHWTPDSLSVPLVGRSLVLADPQPGMTAHNVEFTVAGGLDAELDELVLTADVGGDPITLTCATAGAAIFYTLDGKNPAPRNGTLYAAPLSRPTAGTRLKARAWLAGYLPSNVVNELLT